MAWEECVAGIIKASDGRLTENDIEAILTEIARRAERNKKPRQSHADKLREAAEQMGREVEEAAAILKRNEILNLRKRVARRAFYRKAPDLVTGVEAKLVGVNTPFEGNRLSTFAQSDALTREYLGGLTLDMEREGVRALFAGGKLEDRWAAELYELNNPNGKPGVTGDQNAQKIAQIIHKWQRVAIDGMNREGAWIRDYRGYIARTTHDADRIRRANEKAWADDVLRWADIDRTFGSIDGAKEALPGLWRDFSKGNHVKMDDAALEDFALPTGMNLAKKASATRVIHFKDAASWLAYTRKYGTGKPSEIIVQSLEKSARWTALLREFGTNPRRAFETDIQHLIETGEVGQVDRLKKRLTAMQNRFDVLDGTANTPQNRLSANITAAWLAITRMAKLGSAPISAIVDVASKAAELRYQGVGLLDRYTSGLSAYFQGRGGIGKISGEKKEVADLLLAGMDGMIGRTVARFDRVDTPNGWVARTENLFHRVTGLTAMTDRQRMDAELIMARHLGMRRSKGWGDLEPEVQRILTSFRIGKAEWDALRSVDWKQANGKLYLTPDRAKMIDDATAERLARAEGRIAGDASRPAIERAVEAWKDDLALKVHSYYADRGTYAVLETGAREQAILQQGTRPGTPLGIAMRLWASFKGFPTAMLVRTWGRELYGGQGRWGAMSGIVQMVVASTVLGYASITIRDLIKGRNPRDPTDPATWLAAFIQGGGGTIYADFAFGEFNRYGRSALASFAGPTFGQADDIFSIIGELREGKDFGPELFRLVTNNIPGQNIWYTRAALDFGILYQIQEALSPGYLKRMEKRIKQENKQTFWLKPSEAVR